MNRLRVSGGFWRGYVLGGLSLAVLGLLWQAASQPPPAFGQVPDSGAQRDRMINELVSANKKLTEITLVLKDIRTLSAGEQPDPKTRRPDEKRP